MVNLSSIPIGSILQWDVTTIPTGWNICNGSNGTPNLVNKFLKSVNSNSRSTLGTDTVTLTTSQIPVHTHVVNEAAHVHFYGVTGNAVFLSTNSISPVISSSVTPALTAGNTGGGLLHNNLPSFTGLLYIMRLS